MIVWTDDCADADNTKLGSRVTDGSDSWAVVSGFSEASVYLEVLSNALSANSNISRTWYYVNLDPGSNDYYCQADFKIDASSKVSPAISVRQSASAETLYLLRWSSGWFLRRIVAGSATTLASGTTTNSPVSAPVTGYLEIIDNGANADYTVKAGGSTIYSGIDTSAITARGYAGAGAYFADLGASRYIDNLICGTVAAGGGASGTLTVNASGTLAASGQKGAADLVQLLATGTLAATGAKQAADSIQATASGTLTATGQKGVADLVQLLATGTLAGTGAKQVADSIQATASGTLTATGTSTETHTGTASSDGLGTATALGHKAAQGIAETATAGGQQATGTKAGAASVAPNVTAQLAALGVKHIGGIVSVSGGGTITVAGLAGGLLGRTLAVSQATLRAAAMSGDTLTAAGIHLETMTRGA